MSQIPAAACRPAPAASLLIRDAQERDLDAIRDIYAHHVRYGLATFEEVPPTLDDIGKRRAAVIAGGFPYLTAETEGHVVGYAYASAYRTRSGYRYTIEDSVYVAEGRRGQRVGSALLRELIVRCESGPWRQMLAVIGHSGNTASIALHRRFGFQRVGTFTSVGFKLGRWVDTVLMQRPLGIGDARLPDSGCAPPGRSS